jgi:hypothetical protein
MTLNELIAKYNELAQAAGKPPRKSFDSKAKAEAAIAALQPKGSNLKVKKARATAPVREAGPRGFKFGPVWLASIVAGAGIALKPQNLPKLIETAKFKGVKVTKDLSQAEIAAAVAKTLV